MAIVSRRPSNQQVSNQFARRWTNIYQRRDASDDSRISTVCLLLQRLLALRCLVTAGRSLESAERRRITLGTPARPPMDSLRPETSRRDIL